MYVWMDVWESKKGVQDNKVTASWKVPLPFSVRFSKEDSVRGNPFGAAGAGGEGLKKETCRVESKCRPPGISGLWGASLSARLQHSISKSELVL